MFILISTLTKITRSNRGGGIAAYDQEHLQGISCAACGNRE